MLARHHWHWAAFSGWLIAVIAGMTVLWNYEAQPGLAATAPEQWPADSSIPRRDSCGTMLVWLHPQCPCSRASVSELDRLLVHLPRDIDCQVILTRPRGSDQAFVESDLSRAVHRLPKVSVVIDEGQHEARRFGVSTSGQVLLYDRGAKLRFAGGITAGRGHEGSNDGSASLRELCCDNALAGDTIECHVYGCGLFSAGRGDGS